MTTPITPAERAAMRERYQKVEQPSDPHDEDAWNRYWNDPSPDVLRLLDALEAAEAERDEAHAASARVHETAARVVADEADESDLTIARQRNRLRAREEQVRRLRAEVTRLHALVADLRAATAPVWDEDAVTLAVFERSHEPSFEDSEEGMREARAFVRSLLVHEHLRRP